MEWQPLLDKAGSSDRPSPHHTLLSQLLTHFTHLLPPAPGRIQMWTLNLAISQMEESKSQKGRGLLNSHSTDKAGLQARPHTAPQLRETIVSDFPSDRILEREFPDSAQTNSQLLAEVGISTSISHVVLSTILAGWPDNLHLTGEKLWLRRLSDLPRISLQVCDRSLTSVH